MGLHKVVRSRAPKGYWLVAIVVYATLTTFSMVSISSHESSTTSGNSLADLDRFLRRSSSPLYSRSSSFPSLGPEISPLNVTAPPLQPLRPIDREQYTLRINAWRRPEILLQNVAYFATCDGVAEIQVVWCDTKNEPPKELYNFTNKSVKVDRRSINSLNERYNLSDVGAPTLGIIHIDDDDLYSCFTLDHVFFKWTYNPERLVALQPRKHDEANGIYYGWARHPKSALEQLPRGRYTMVLPTLGGVVHRDYLDWYMRYFPRPFFHDIAKQFNCEDIAFSFFVTALTQGKPPLLGDFWAMQSTAHVTDYAYNTASAISANGKTHKVVRSNCTKRAVHELGLGLIPYDQLVSNMVPGDPARFEPPKKRSMHSFPEPTANDWFQLNFEMGAPSSSVDNVASTIVPRHARLLSVIDQWKASPDMFKMDTLIVKKDAKSPLFNKVY